MHLVTYSRLSGWKGSFTGQSEMTQCQIDDMRLEYRDARGYVRRVTWNGQGHFITKHGFVWSFPGVVVEQTLTVPKKKTKITIPPDATEFPYMPTERFCLWTRKYPYDLVKIKWDYTDYNTARRKWKLWSISHFDRLCWWNGYEVVR